MSVILSQISDAVGSVVSLPAVQTGAKLIAAYVVILWLGAAFWAFRDMRRRTHDPLAPYASAGLVVAFTPLLFPAGVLVHLVLRPPETLEDHSEHELRLALLEADAAGTSCPACTAPIADGWLLCPACGTRLRRKCPSCDKPVELHWDLCAWCGQDFRPAPRTSAAAPVTTIPVPVVAQATALTSAEPDGAGPSDAPWRSAPVASVAGIASGLASLAPRRAARGPGDRSPRRMAAIPAAADVSPAGSSMKARPDR